jgi:hypothetical protein
MTRSALAVLGLFLLAGAPASEAGEVKEWIDLFADGLDAWKMPQGEWQRVGDVELDSQNPRKFLAKEGKGVWLNASKSRNLLTKQLFSDIEVHLEFNLPKGSNSGVKFHGHYEIQLCDSFGKKEPSGEDCGGIYPRAELKPKYTHIDKGIPPKVNACKPAGEWQRLDVVFRAPRFDAGGKKVKNACVVWAKLNGQSIHEDQELLTPTGDRWKNAEMFEGPLMLQADHGPVAFRNVRVKRIDSASERK